MIDLFGIYRPRRTPLHLLPAWVKTAMLFAAAVVFAFLHGPVPALISVAAAGALLASTLPYPRQTLRGLVPIAIIGAILVAYHWWQGEPARGVELAAEFAALVLLSLAITASTPMNAMLDLVSRAARPIRRIVPPEALALMVSLMLRGVPEVTRIMTQSRDAARARGLDRHARAMLIPAAVRTVGYALQVGDAITARGLADFETEAAASR